MSFFELVLLEIHLIIRIYKMTKIQLQEIKMNYNCYILNLKYKRIFSELQLEACEIIRLVSL